MINPAKSDIGVISKKILQEKIEKVLQATGLNSWQSTQAVLDWYKQLPQDKNLSFLAFDIENYYPSINLEVLKKALNYAKNFCDISDKEMEIILHARKTFLMSRGETYVKKDSNGNFDVTQGGFDSCQVCEIVGIYLLSEIEKQLGPDFIMYFGIYRDDGAIAAPANKKTMDKIRQKLVSIFAQNGFKITYQVNVKLIEFLDVKLDLKSREFRPYRKPGDGVPNYVHRQSNHPPVITKKLPSMINNRLSTLSCNEKVFDEEKPIYQTALNNAGYNYQLKYEPKEKKKKRQRKRKVRYFNPIWSSNICNPVGGEFLSALDECFPKEHPLHKFYNRSTMKVSYRTARNLKSYIDSHNKKILEPQNQEKPSCNCRDKSKCPLPGECNSTNVIYQVDVESEGKIKTYFGQAKKLKRRIYQHRMAFKNQNSGHATALSNYIWKLKKYHKPFKISWSIKARAPTYKSGSKSCRLCTLEKVAIAECPPSRLLNCRTEILTKCIHMHNFELRPKNLKK